MKRKQKQPQKQKPTEQQIQEATQETQQEQTSEAAKAQQEQNPEAAKAQKEAAPDQAEQQTSETMQTQQGAAPDQAEQQIQETKQEQNPETAQKQQEATQETQQEEPQETKKAKKKQKKQPKGKKKQEKAPLEIPTPEQLEAELNRVRYKNRYAGAVRGTIYTLIVVAAAAVLVATLLMPVLRIYGNSMSPTLSEGNIVLSLRTDNFERGDIVAFYYNNKILVKRVIAMPGEWVNIDENGGVYINDIYQEEPYLEEGARALGECNIELPYQVPEGRVFVMGDHRSVSEDSRSTTIGCVSEEQLVGRLEFRVWPIGDFGPVK